jgi:hypothetical protein
LSGEIDVVTEAMRRHAADLDDIAASGCAAVRAGEDVTTQGEAFGRMCAFLGRSLRPVQMAGTATTALAVASVHATATQVRAVAAAFDEVDEAVAEAADRLRGAR